MGNASQSSADAATELMKAVARLRARLRVESAPTEMSWTWSQLLTLGRIVEEGPTTPSALAKAEHVRRQSMAETLAALRAEGLIAASQDLDDGRKTLISATRKGQTLYKTVPAAGKAWLDLALRTLLEPAEQQTLLKASAIITRVADSNI